MTPHRSQGEWTIAMKQQAAVARLGQLGLQGLVLSELLSEALAEVADTLGVRSVVLLQLDVHGSHFTAEAAIFDGRLVSDGMLKTIRLPAGLDSMPGYTVLQGKPTVSSDISNDPRFTSRAGDYDLSPESAVIAPVGWGDRPWGVLAAYDDQTRSWTTDDVHFAQSMANTIGMALTRYRTEQALDDTRASLELSMSAGGLGAWTWDLAAGHLELNGPGLEVYGLTDEFDSDALRLLEQIVAEDRASLRSDVFEAIQSTGEFHLEFRIRRADDDAVRWLEIWGRIIDETGDADRLVGVIADITERRQADEIKETLLLAEQRARVDAEWARERLALVAEVSALLSGSLDPLVVIDVLARSCVPRLAEVCVVSLLDEDGKLVDAKTSAVDDDTRAAIADMRRRRSELGDVGGLWNEPEMVKPGARTVLTSITDDD